MPTLVDSNVILDIWEDNPRWFDWSVSTLAKRRRASTLIINPIVYAEISVGFDTVEELEGSPEIDQFRREPLPYEAAFIAGKAFVDYRRRGGQRRSPLPDFYIGAHAAVQGYALLTRDPRRYRTYFPMIDLIAPD